MTNLYGHKHGSGMIANGIRRKAGFVIAATAAITLLVSISIIYVVGSFAIKKKVGYGQFEITRTLSLAAAENILGEFQDAESYADRILWKEACRKSNLKYSGMDDTAIMKNMLENDRRWTNSPIDDIFIKEYVSGGIPDSMRGMMRMRGTISEIILTNKFGGIIFASGKTSDFYQADEDWWQKTYNGGKGFLYFGDLEYDNSSAKWGATIAVPVTGHDGDVIGVCKVFIHIERLFDFINRFRIGLTGRAFLVNDSGAILVSRDIVPLSTNIMSSADFVKLKNAANGYVLTIPDVWGKKKSVVSICPIASSFLQNNGIQWSIIISQDSNEAFGLLNTFLLMLSYIAVFFIPLTIPVGLLIGDRLARPIEALSKAARQIATGDLDQVINIKTGDEIEQFAETFKIMVKNLKENRERLIATKNKLSGLALNQEDIIRIRTTDLTKTQEATLNILEDLVEAKARLEKYSKDLESALQIKSDFTSTVSHELRTPLAAIKEGIAIVLDGTAGEISGGQKEFLEIAKRNVDRLARLINDILDFQKLEAGKMPFYMTLNNINDVVRDAASAMYPIIEKKHIELITDTDNDTPKVTFDKDKITQVLINLLNNACKYTEAGSITIKAEKKDDLLKVSVSDTGSGIKTEDLPKLFRQFTQLENITDRKTGSTGLGLSICKDIIKAHNGKIWAESEYGKGSTFSFILPITERRL